jgi:G3E family GTPase
MKIHLLSGFLGSGKTTAIANAAVSLMNQGKRVGVITNDQGKYQVDGKFINSKGIPTVEVSNGCFCCNYETLDDHIINLDKNQSPDYIFAESVGSCTDIIATVLKPLQAYRNNLFETISLSTFTDARLFFLHLKNKKLPFNDDVTYIIKKQYEEADILVINKIDLLDSTSIQFIKKVVPERFPNKTILFQNSNDECDVQHWIKKADNTSNSKERTSLSIDYDKYGKGEAELGWLDQNCVLEGENALEVTLFLTELIHSGIVKNEYTIGHLKFTICDGNSTWKRSYTSFGNAESESFNITSNAATIELLINARIECSPNDLKRIISECLEQSKTNFNMDIKTTSQDAFSPGYPTPTHHIA